MPLYHQIVTASARASPAALADLLRRCAKQITAAGGVVRSCEHHGVTRLPHRVRSRHASAGGAPPGRAPPITSAAMAGGSAAVAPPIAAGGGWLRWRWWTGRSAESVN